MIAIDGKVLRRSRDRGFDKAAIAMVNARASANRLVLGQVKVDDRSNEITAIPQLLQALEASGCIVSIDAVGRATAAIETGGYNSVFTKDWIQSAIWTVTCQGEAGTGRIGDRANGCISRYDKLAVGLNNNCPRRSLGN